MYIYIYLYIWEFHPQIRRHVAVVIFMGVSSSDQEARRCSDFYGGTLSL